MTVQKKVQRLFLLFLIVPLAVFAEAMKVTNEIEQFIPEPEKVGKARLTFLFWDVYDATLFAPKGQWQADKPFALQLTYLRELNGKEIANRSIEEIQKQGFNHKESLTTWEQQLKKLIPNVTKNSRITGLMDERQYTHFYFDGQFLGSIEDPDFSKRFFAIWLGPKTSEPELRNQLLGITE